VKDLLWLGVFFVFISASQIGDAYVERLRRANCHEAGGRFVHVEGHGCRMSHDVCEESK